MRKLIVNGSGPREWRDQLLPPLVNTPIGPVLAPLGTVAVICVSELTVVSGTVSRWLELEFVTLHAPECPVLSDSVSKPNESVEKLRS